MRLRTANRRKRRAFYGANPDCRYWRYFIPNRQDMAALMASSPPPSPKAIFAAYLGDDSGGVRFYTRYRP